MTMVFCSDLLMLKSTVFGGSAGSSLKVTKFMTMALLRNRPPPHVLYSMRSLKTRGSSDSRRVVYLSFRTMTISALRRLLMT